MKQSTFLTLIIAGVCGSTPSVTLGAVVQYVSPASSPQWFAAAGPEATTVDFETYAGPLGNQYLANHGVAFSSHLYGAPAIVSHGYQTVPTQRWARWRQWANDNPPDLGLSMSFTDPQRAIALNHPVWGGCWTPPGSIGFTGLEVEFTLGGIVIGGWSQDSYWGQTQTLYTDTFLGLTSDQEFDGARIWWNQPTDTPQYWSDAAFTDLYFSTVPAPSALAVFVALGILRHRRRLCSSNP